MSQLTEPARKRTANVHRSRSANLTPFDCNVLDAFAGYLLLYPDCDYDTRLEQMELLYLSLKDRDCRVAERVVLEWEDIQAVAASWVAFSVREIEACMDGCAHRALQGAALVGEIMQFLRQRLVNLYLPNTKAKPTRASTGNQP